MKFYLQLTRVALLVLLGQLLCSGVNLKNGNFYISYTDVEIPKKLGALSDMTRTYNSKSVEIGLFGYGWGTLIESHLYNYPDGTIVIAEHGSGGKTVFTSPFSTVDMLDLMIDRLIEVGIQEGSIENTPNALLSKRDEYLNDLELRLKHWDNFVKKNLLDYAFELPTGAEWESFQRGNERIIKTDQGYQRIKSSRIDDFNAEGQLIKIDEKNGNWTSLDYTQGNLSAITNADGTGIKLTTNADGFITSITNNGKTAIFRYEDKNLVYARDIAGNAYAYAYDDNHNMVKITYNPDRDQNTPEDSMLMEYEPKTGFLSKITDRNGETTSYQYTKFFREDGSLDDFHYGTTVIKEGYDGRPVSNVYEYFIGVKGNGEDYTQKIITMINGISTTTLYDELCALPVEINRGANVTRFKYNNRCLLLEKTTPYDSITMQYHPDFEKMTYVKNSSGEYHFEYDDKANLTYVSKNDGTWARLEYDDRGKISTMTQEKKALEFSYNDRGKPSKILLKTEETTGSINVTYDEYGEIISVKSEEGSTMALEVTQAFQQLLSLVKPAGVNLNM